MARSARGRRWISSHARSTPYPLPSYHPQITNKEDGLKKPCNLPKDWEDATCSVCMEFPHKAVLLLCSSHDKGCRPYICGTSHRYSNCLDQFKNAYMKVETGSGLSNWPLYDKPDVAELACPLCRGQVKGWTVVEPARDYLNMKKRSCMQDGCSFVGTYKELRRHVKAVHPCAKPRQVDPALQQQWRSLEQERDREDVMSTIRSTMPGAVVLGDYVLERNSAFDAIEDAQIISSLVAIFQQFGNATDGFGARLRISPRRIQVLDEDEDSNSFQFDDDAPSLLANSDEDDDDYVGQTISRQVQSIGVVRAARRRRRRSNRNNTVGA